MPRLTDFPTARYVGAAARDMSTWISYWVTDAGQVLTSAGVLPGTSSLLREGARYADAASALIGVKTALREAGRERRLPWADDRLPALLTACQTATLPVPGAEEGPADALTVQCLFHLVPRTRKV